MMRISCVGPFGFSLATTIFMLVVSTHRCAATMNVWKELTAAPATPRARYLQSCSSRANQTLMYGGLENNSTNGEFIGTGLTAVNTTWIFNQNDLTWFQIFPPSRGSPDWPQSRAGASLTFHPTTASWLLFGGMTSVSTTFGVLNDLWVMQAATQTWRIINQQPGHSMVPSTRGFHIGQLVNHLLIIYGGISVLPCIPSSASVEVQYGIRDDSCILEDTWQYNITSNTWTLLFQSSAPGPLWGTGNVVMNNVIYAVGGATTWYGTPNITTLDVYAFSFQNDVPIWESIAKSPFKVLLPSTIAVDDTRFFMIGGYTPEFTIYDNPYMFDITKKIWYLVESSDPDLVDSVEGRVGGCLFPIDSAYGLLGGINLLSLQTNLGGIIFNEEKQKFLSVQVPEISKPSDRIYAASCLVGNATYLYGGWTGGEVLGHLWQLEFGEGGQLVWTVNAVNDIHPPPAIGPTLNNLNDEHLVLFGGAGKSQNFNSIWVFSLIDYTWKKEIPTSIDAPSGRYLHSATFFPSSNALYIFGGSCFGSNGTATSFGTNLFYFQDLWAYEFDSSKWVQITNSTQNIPRPSARSSHSATMQYHKGKPHLYIFGGREETKVLSDLWMFNPGTWEWKLLASTTPAGPLGAAVTSELSNNKFIITGGGTEVGITNQFTDISGKSWTVTTKFDKVIWQEIPSVNSLARIFATGVVSSVTADPTLFVFSGVESETATSVPSTKINAMVLACHEGSYAVDYLTDACSACKVGEYSPRQGERKCLACPEGTTTSFVGATGHFSCTQCVKGYCHSHGDCSVNSQGAPECDCHHLYRGPRCEDTLVGVVVGSVIGGLIMIVVVGILIYMTRRRLFALESFNELQVSLLEATQSELKNLESVWEIDSKDLRWKVRIDLQCEGAFGEVWLCEWQDVMVAVKRLKYMHQMNDGATVDFENEVKFMRSLRHRNIVWFLGAGCIDNAPFLVTEYLARGSLRNILSTKKIPLSLDTRVNFLLDTANGMNFIHSLTPSRIHRDLKSANLLVSERWVVKVADFGTGKILNLLENGQGDQLVNSGDCSTDEEASCRMTSNVGTLVYTAPEVWKGCYSLPCDVYSFGIVMWEVLTRNWPYEDDLPPWELRSLVQDGGRPDIPVKCPEFYRFLMEQCWSDHPEQRPTFADVVDTISSWEVNGRRQSFLSEHGR